jgi:uncharacterized damage-inducible protein DinB
VSASDALAAAFVEQFAKHNDRLRAAVRGLAPDVLDRSPGPDTNSIAVLVAHATGSQLGWLNLAAGRPHDRDRDAEFRTRAKDTAELEAMIDHASRAIPELVRAAVAGNLDAIRRSTPEREITAGFALVHALEHLAEHVGQVELTRQLVAPRS